jgi:methionyl-tRNA formyltransferase
MPDKPIGRGQQVKKNSIKETAEQLGINNIFDWPKIKKKADDGTFLADSQVAASLQSLEADYFVVVAYGNIMPQDILDIPHFGSINVH